MNLLRPTLHQLRATLRLYFRSPVGMLYGYLFPTVFLVAFWVLYRHESVPLVRHMGELLTVTALGGACFGLPTTLVSERELGVWRRFRLAPVSTGSLLTGTVLARYLLLLSAALLQLALALAIGMPLPAHPLELWLAFTLVAFAFLGLGLVIAALADTVPAVQALGQAVFLPMLIVGGVAVPLTSLPAWAQHLSAFLPGRYAVEALQACVTGAGLGEARFSLLALLLIGTAGSLAGARLFRWDAQQRFWAGRDRGWVGVALAGWIAVGLLAEAVGVVSPVGRPAAPAAPVVIGASDRPPQPDSAPAPDSSPARPLEPAPRTRATGDPQPVRPGGPAPPPPPAPMPAGPWASVTQVDIERLDFSDLPPDDGLVAPFAPANREPRPASLARELECVRQRLPEWEPGQKGDPVQRVRNYLYVAAVPDIFQMDRLEPWLPRLVLERLRQDFAPEQLVRILYWVASHPDEGSHAAADQLGAVCIDTGRRPLEVEQLRERTSVYALKLLGRLTGRISPG